MSTCDKCGILIPNGIGRYQPRSTCIQCHDHEGHRIGGYDIPHDVLVEYIRICQARRLSIGAYGGGMQAVQLVQLTEWKNAYNAVFEAIGLKHDATDDTTICFRAALNEYMLPYTRHWGLKVFA